MADLPAAVSRIDAAIERGETIFIHGDFDVDGMAGTALLTRWLNRLGGRVFPFIPHRTEHGYDLGSAGLKRAKDEGASLLVTVDCGIVAHDAVQEARSLGMDVIVTDHHAPETSLPAALAVLNPSRGDCPYPEEVLCGTGVSFKLCQGLAASRGVPDEELHPHLDLVGLATIADLVPLTGENRILARYGLRALARTSKPGLRALIWEAGLGKGEISAGSVGFALAPRLNAVGRLADPQLGLRLLLTEDPGEARELAREAGTLNRARQDADRRITEEALEDLAHQFDPDEDYGVVLERDEWHPGVIGIVASRVAERIHRPAVMVSLQGDRGRGSARSIPGFHLLEGIRACREHLERFGGHKQAAGLEISRHRIPAFREAFNRAARQVLEGKELRPSLSLELEVEVGDMSQELYGYLKYLGPHGLGNPRPVFWARNLNLAGPARVVGSGHLKMLLRSGGGGSGGERLEAIGFGLAERVGPGSLGSGPVNVAFHLQENEYRGVRRLQARLKDIQRVGS
jgi:single-stranded-DNA-specific exonuclease